MSRLDKDPDYKTNLDEIERWLNLREKNEPVPESMVQNIDWLVQKLKKSKLLLEKQNERMKLINGKDDKCIVENWVCPNHYLIRETEEFLNSLRGEK